jgi:hypothetical protein
MGIHWHEVTTSPDQERQSTPTRQAAGERFIYLQSIMQQYHTAVQYIFAVQYTQLSHGMQPLL